MPKELSLYSPIYDFVAQDLIAKIEDHIDEDIVLRLNTPGGSIFAAYGIYQKIKEHGNVSLKVDGAAMSAGAFLPMYCKYAECLNTSRFVFHRADMFVWDDNDQEFLNGVNKDLKAQMKLKIDAEKFKEVTGISIDDMFNPDTRIDITLTGVQAKKIGLVNKVNKLTPELQAEITAFNNKFSVAAKADEPISKPTIKMTLEKLKAEHPEVYAQIFALGVSQEKDRVEACLVFNELDPVAVKAAIESGKPLTQKQMSDFALKAMSVKTLEAVKKDSTGSVQTEEVSAQVKTEKENALAAFEKSVDATLKLKTV